MYSENRPSQTDWANNEAPFKLVLAFTAVMGIGGYGISQAVDYMFGDSLDTSTQQTPELD